MKLARKLASCPSELTQMARTEPHARPEMYSCSVFCTFTTSYPSARAF